MTSLFWRDGAACTLKDAPTFDELDAARRGGARDRVEAAKAVCRTCPLISFCFQQGVEGRESGVWGGGAARERPHPQNAGEVSASRTCSMTAGREALHEAMRIEQARIYSQPQREFSQPPARELDAEIAYWHGQHQSTASIAFRLGTTKTRVTETLTRLGAA